MKKLLIIPLLCLMTGCGIFKSERINLPPAEPRALNEQREIISEQAKINHELSKIIREKGAKPGDEITVLLEGGSRVILKYVNEPYRDISTNPKDVRRSINRANDVAEETREATSEYSDDVYERRENLINKTNLKWDWKKLLGGGLITWILIGVGIPILCAFFPVIIPFIQIAWQVLKAGIGSLAIMAKLGLTGVKNVVGAVEKFRDAHKDDNIGKEFNAHMSKELDSKDKDGLDKFKNHFGI